MVLPRNAPAAAAPPAGGTAALGRQAQITGFLSETSAELLAFPVACFFFKLHLWVNTPRCVIKQRETSVAEPDPSKSVPPPSTNPSATSWNLPIRQRLILRRFLPVLLPDFLGK